MQVPSLRAARRCCLRCGFLLAVALCALRPARARADSDVQAWLELDLEHEFSKKWAVTYEQHLRFDDNLSRLSQVLPDLSLTMRLVPAVRAVAGYRAQYVRTGSGDFELRHRPYGGAQARLERGALRLSARALFTGQIRTSGQDRFRPALRTRFAAEWRARAWRPRVWTEIFFDLDTSALDKVRSGIDLARPFGKAEVSLGYRLEVPVQDTTELTLHILALSSAFEL